MCRVPIWVLFVTMFFLLLHETSCEEEEIKRSLIEFFNTLSGGKVPQESNWGWNMTSDPCTDQWRGVACNKAMTNVKKITLEGLNLTGTLDASSLCRAQSLYVLSLKYNHLTGGIPEEIANCKQLTHFYIDGNQFSGNLPDSLSRLNNLKRLIIPNNNFSGNLPDLPRISGLTSFLAQNNRLSGRIPQFDFSNLQEFNVSFNNFSGPIPDLDGRFDTSGFMGNTELCGKPLPNACPPSPPPKKRSKGVSNNQILIYTGYSALGLALLAFVAFWLKGRFKAKNKRIETGKEGSAVHNSSNKPTYSSSECKTSASRSEYSITSAENSMASSLVVLSGPVSHDIRFEDLLKAPAELLGRGKHGSLYKVIYEDGMSLAVKRIKDWTISSEAFKRRMYRLDKVKHPNILPAMAFYCSKQEKLIVYEYQQNGNLFRLLHGTQNSLAFDWGSRLGVAATIADALAFMHVELRDDGIAHGNLKSSNILMNKNMQACISEYGLMVVDNQDNLPVTPGESSRSMDPSRAGGGSTFNMDIYGFGVILLELLTGKLVQNNGFDLARWVNSVVREEWTVEVFDKALISEDANEDRMVNLLQVALKCINPSPEARPSINQVAGMINAIKEEEERSIVSESGQSKDSRL